MSLINKILNIVICYNNNDEVLDYAKMLFKQSESKNIILVIVVNQLEKKSLIKFKNDCKLLKENIIIYQPNQNLGYLNGLIYGYKKFSETENTELKWVVFSNTDIDYVSDDFYLKLNNGQYNKDVWCIGPSIYVPENDLYVNPVCINRRTKQELNLLINIFSIPVVNILYIIMSKAKGKIKKTTNGESGFYYEVHGCYFIINQEFAEILKNKPYETFLYSEEAFIAELIYYHNKKIYYDSDLKIIHNEHSVTNKLGLKKKAFYIAESLKYIRRVFYS